MTSRRSACLGPIPTAPTMRTRAQCPFLRAATVRLLGRQRTFARLPDAQRMKSMALPGAMGKADQPNPMTQERI